MIDVIDLVFDKRAFMARFFFTNFWLVAFVLNESYQESTEKIMFTNTNFLLAEQLHRERQQELLNQIRLNELLPDYRARRRETMKRLLGLLRSVAMMYLTSYKAHRSVVHGA